MASSALMNTGLLSPRYSKQQPEQNKVPIGVVDLSFNFMPELSVPQTFKGVKVREMGPLDMWAMIQADSNSRRQYYCETQSLLELLVSVLDVQLDGDATRELHKNAEIKIKQWQNKYNLKRNRHKCLSEHEKVSSKMAQLYDYFSKCSTGKQCDKLSGNRALVNLSYAIEDNRRGALKDLCAIPSSALLF